MSLPDSKTITQKAVAALKLQGVAKNSFIQLCDDGCEPETLANWFVFVTIKSEIDISPDRFTKEGKKRRSYKISPRPMDSFDTALGGIEKRDLEPLQKAVLTIAKKIDKLNKTRIVHYMSDEEYSHEIYKLPQLLIYYSQHFIPLVLTKLEGTGAKQRPDFTMYLNSLIDYVKESTGAPKYGLLCDVLNGLGQDWNEGSLKEWRKRNKPTEAKATRKSRSL